MARQELPSSSESWQQEVEQKLSDLWQDSRIGRLTVDERISQMSMFMGSLPLEQQSWLDEVVGTNKHGKPITRAMQIACQKLPSGGSKGEAKYTRATKAVIRKRL